jgi:hypothetical protein
MRHPTNDDQWKEAHAMTETCFRQDLHVLPRPSSRVLMELYQRYEGQLHFLE